MNKEVLKTIKILTKLRKQYNVSPCSIEDTNTLSDIDKNIKECLLILNLNKCDKLSKVIDIIKEHEFACKFIRREDVFATINEQAISKIKELLYVK